MFNTNRCQNNGYLDPRTCNRCICPDGFGGVNCDQRDPGATCGETIINLVPSASGQITIGNPMPTSTLTQRQYCVFHIRVIENKEIDLFLIINLFSSHSLMERFEYDWILSIQLVVLSVV